MKSIGKYKVLGLLGRGGMGAVYKALLPVAERIVAVKLLRPGEHLLDLMGREAVIELFEREARTMARLDHPNIAQVLDYDEHHGWPFFVMAYHCNNLGLVIGESFRIEDRSRRLRLDKAVRYSRQALKGLKRLHAAGIIHRDIKPYNMLLTQYDELKLIDFGLSRMGGEAWQAPAGMKVGSPFYTAPELEADPDTADPRSDIFSLAVTLYRMVTGCLPDSVLEEKDEEAPDLAAGVGPELTPEWEAFFHKALARNPGRRHQSAEQMLHDLDRLYARWRDRLEAVCSLPEDMEQAAGHDRAPGFRKSPPRSEPHKVRPAEAREAFGLDELNRPRIYRAAELVPQGHTVLAPDAALLWQQAGSDYPLTWEEAFEYVAGLNEEGFAGRSDWRLPTVDELLTLLPGPPRLGDFCLPEVFDPRQEMLWSADRKSYTAAWYLNAALGFVGHQDVSCGLWVRAVSGGGS